MRFAHITPFLTFALLLCVVGCREIEYQAIPAQAAPASQSPVPASQAPTPASQPPAPSGPGSVSVSWLAPVQNDNGTLLTDLAGFQIHYGKRYADYPYEVSVGNPGATSHVVNGLAPGLYYFVVAAVNRDGLESPPSKPQRIQVD